jgi:hypothetical protein
MKRLIVLVALAVSLCAPAALGQGVRNEPETNTPTNLYITSMYSVRVYLNNRVVDILRPGQRAKIVRSRGGWLYVQYQRGYKLYEGWIRR